MLLYIGVGGTLIPPHTNESGPTCTGSARPLSMIHELKRKTPYRFGSVTITTTQHPSYPNKPGRPSKLLLSVKCAINLVTATREADMDRCWRTTLACSRGVGKYFWSAGSNRVRVCGRVGPDKGNRSSALRRTIATASDLMIDVGIESRRNRAAASVLCGDEHLFRLLSAA